LGFTIRELAIGSEELVLESEEVVPRSGEVILGSEEVVSGEEVPWPETVILLAEGVISG
jgi:hypothetical protein